MAKKTNISIIVVTILIIINLISPVYAKNTTSTSKSSKTANVTTNRSQKSSNTSKNVNETSNKSSNSKSSTNITTSNTNSTSNETTSSNANLIALGIKPNDFSGFKESKTEYETTVPYTINEVEVYATPKNRNNTVTGTGKIKLEEGLNTAKIVVTTEKGESKTYTINIKRLKQRRKRKW